MRRSVGIILFAGLLGLGVARAAELPLTRFERVEIAPAKTSVYVGTVSLTMPPLARTRAVYETTYVAKVFPYFFYNEKGKLSVTLSDAELRQLERGEPVEFKGRAVRDDGAERRVEGKATPTDAVSGRVKVRVFYSKRIELIFNTTYRFPEKSAPATTTPAASLTPPPSEK